MADWGTLSHSSKGRSLKYLFRHFMTSKRAFWRRWWLPLPLAILLTTLATWCAVLATPHLRPFNTGWLAIAVALVLLVILAATQHAVSPLRSVKDWAHGPYPPSAGAELAWYLAEPIRGRRTALLLTALPAALVQLWGQAMYPGGLTVDVAVAVGGFFFWAGLLRGLIHRREPAIAVTASGLFNGAEFYRWEEIGQLRMEEENLMVATVKGRQRYVEVPATDLQPAIEVYGLVNHYLRRAEERPGIADAVRPSITGYGPVIHR